MATNNNVNFPNLTAKGTPTTSDIMELSDVAASGIPKQAPIGNFPALNAQQITQFNPSGFAYFSCQLPGMFNDTQSDSIAQSLAISLNVNVLLVPFYLSTNWTTASLSIVVKTGLAASTATLGFYAATPADGGAYANWPTGAPLAVGSIATATSNAIATASVATTLSANTLYFAAIQLSSSTTLTIAVGKYNFASTVVTANSGSAITPNFLTYANSYSAGSLPTLTQSSLAMDGNLYGPIINGR